MYPNESEEKKNKQQNLIIKKVSKKSLTTHK